MVENYWITRLCTIIFLLAKALGQNCSNETLSDREIADLAMDCTASSSSCSRLGEHGDTYLFPHLTVTCSGMLVTWTISGILSNGEVKTDVSLIIWRAEPGENRTYQKQPKKTSLVDCEGTREQIDMQVFKCRLGNGLPVTEGDIIGMEVPFFDPLSNKFVPYFYNQSSQHALPDIYYYHGTSVQTFNTIISRAEKSLPLLAVSVMDVSTAATIATSQASTYSNLGSSNDHIMIHSTYGNESMNNNNGITLNPLQITGIVIGALLFTTLILLLLAMQCCVILRTRKRRGRRVSNVTPRDRLCSTEPYAMVDLRGVNLFKLKISSECSGRPQRQEDIITLSQNPCYSSSIKSAAKYSHEDSIYVSKEDIRFRDGSYTLEELELFQGGSQFKGNNSVGRSSPLVMTDNDHLSCRTPSDDNATSLQVLTSPFTSEENNSPANKQWKRSQSDNTEDCDDESIYY